MSLLMQMLAFLFAFCAGAISNNHLGIGLLLGALSLALIFGEPGPPK